MKRVVTLVAVVVFVIGGITYAHLAKTNPWLMALYQAIGEPSTAPYAAQDHKTIRFYKQFRAQPGFINSKGKVLFVSKVDDLGDVHQGLAAFRKGRKWGFIDTKGKVVIEPQYARAHDFHEGLAAVRIGKTWSFIDKSGKVVIPSDVWSYVEDFKGGVAMVKRANKFGFIGKKGDVVQPVEFDLIDPLREDTYLVLRHGKYGYLDRFAHVIVSPKYDDACVFSEGLAAVKENGKYGYIDNAGKIAIAPTFTSAQIFRNGAAVVELNGKYHLIDRQGQQTCKKDFKYITAIGEDPASSRVKPVTFVPMLLENGWNFVDGKTGKEISTVCFASVAPFSEGIASVDVFADANAVRVAVKNMRGALRQQALDEAEQAKAEAEEEKSESEQPETSEQEEKDSGDTSDETAAK